MQNRLEMLRIFAAAAEASSFKDAATRLGISPQAVTRAVRELEESLGELLFHRNTRGNHITAFGEQLAQRARERVREIDALFQSASPAAADELQGTVRITAPTSLGRVHIMPLLVALSRRHPGLNLDLRLSDQFSDVVDEQIDIGVRVGFLGDSRFVARAIAKCHFYIVATPALIAQHGQPTTMEDMARLPCTALIDHKSGRPWPWFLASDQQWAPRQVAFTTDDANTEFDAVLAGMGYGQIAAYLAIPHIRAGRLRTVLPEYTPNPWDLSVYRPQRGPVAARIRLVFDQLLALFSDPQRFPIEP